MHPAVVEKANTADEQNQTGGKRTRQETSGPEEGVDGPGPYTAANQASIPSQQQRGGHSNVPRLHRKRPATRTTPVLQGEVEGDDQSEGREDESWECKLCTFLNTNGAYLACATCLAPRTYDTGGTLGEESVAPTAATVSKPGGQGTGHG